MGLIQERWCCAWGSLSRLDMNTYQTSIKPVYYYSVTIDHILSISDKHERTTVVPTELKKI